MPLWALVKVLSLGYLLSALCLSLAALAWRLLRGRLDPTQRAGAAFHAFSASFALCVLLGALIWAGVVSRLILMTTPYFHTLMYGGWGAGIAASGLLVLGVSVLLGRRAWRRSQADAPTTAVLGCVGRLPLLASPAVPAAALVGVWRPRILVNPAYWAASDSALRELTLRHELCHWRRGDNARKLLLQFISGLYFVLPWLRGLSSEYSRDSEYAVDRACAAGGEAEAYLALIEHTGAFTGRPATHRASYVGGALAARIAALSNPRRGSAAAASLAVCAVCLCASLPGLVMLSHPTLRCLLACYLGY
jgi:hypothetical protein